MVCARGSWELLGYFHVRWTAYACCCAVVLELAWGLVALWAGAGTVDLYGAGCAAVAVEVGGEAGGIYAEGFGVLYQQAAGYVVVELVLECP